MTKTRLATEAGFSVRTLVATESNESRPDADTVRRLAKALRFPESFFYQDDLEEIQAEGVSFRSMTKMTAAQRGTALGAASVALLLNSWIEQRFVLPGCQVPDLSGDFTPEGAADALRREWGLGEASISNMVHLLESHGVRVFSLAIEAREIDAFSFWRGGTPFTFLNMQKSPERSRYDAAHELGHLVMHKHGAPSGAQAETEANAFASAFLMPRDSVLARVPKLATVENLVALKAAWGVSVVALARRLHEVGALSVWHYHTLCKQMSVRRYRTHEPPPLVQRETSQIIAKILAALREDGVTRADICAALNVASEELDELMFGLVLTAVPGRHRTAQAKAGRRPQLRVVSVAPDPTDVTF